MFLHQSVILFTVVGGGVWHRVHGRGGVCCRGACMTDGMCGRGTCVKGVHGRGVCVAGGHA